MEPFIEARVHSVSFDIIHRTAAKAPTPGKRCADHLYDLNPFTGREILDIFGKHQFIYLNGSRFQSQGVIFLHTRHSLCINPLYSKDHDCAPFRRAI